MSLPWKVKLRPTLSLPLWEPLSLRLCSSKLVFAPSARPGLTDRCYDLGGASAESSGAGTALDSASHLHSDPQQGKRSCSVEGVRRADNDVLNRQKRS